MSATVRFRTGFSTQDESRNDILYFIYRPSILLSSLGLHSFPLQVFSKATAGVQPYLRALCLRLAAPRQVRSIIAAPE